MNEYYKELEAYELGFMVTIIFFLYFLILSIIDKELIIFTVGLLMSIITLYVSIELYRRKDE